MVRNLEEELQTNQLRVLQRLDIPQYISQHDGESAAVRADGLYLLDHAVLLRAKDLGLGRKQSNGDAIPTRRPVRAVGVPRKAVHEPRRRGVGKSKPALGLRRADVNAGPIWIGLVSLQGYRGLRGPITRRIHTGIIRGPDSRAATGHKRRQ